MTLPSESYREILLSQGQIALVDAADYDWLSQWKWYARWDKKMHSFYAWRSVKVSGKVKSTAMSRLITNAPRGTVVDHWNHNTLDNRRFNLRPCPTRHNRFNNQKQANNTSGFKGVCLNNDKTAWKAYIKVDGKRLHLGYFPLDKKQEAADAYDRAALLYHGEFALTNRMLQEEKP